MFQKYLLTLLFLFAFISFSFSSVIKSDNDASILSHLKNHINKAGEDANNIMKEEEIGKAKITTNTGFVNGFLVSIYVIIISELGDKTFFIAAIMSIKNPRLIVYIGAMAALGTMTVLSAALGMATTIIPRSITYYISGILFLIFGIKMIKEAYDMSPNDTTEEYEEVQSELRKRESEFASSKTLIADPETGIIKSDSYTNSGSSSSKMGVIECLTLKMKKCQRFLYIIFSKILVEAFILTFLAEWGDRSQMTTIVLAATKDVIGVIIGGTLGHAICTGIAVIAGRFIAQKIPVRALTLIGGITFILFGIHTFISDPRNNS